MTSEEIHLHDLFKYRVEIYYSEEDEAYIANVPDLKYCSAFGETPEDALKEIKIAIKGWIETVVGRR
ncbi:MAG: type II toxin-antitoxin system HicB family antitoxin [Candidatus Heimdallarchaeota archaeon]|nr:type II toxin-antitoxin system HicB family antitoxin [Candidatus Heimdallarchaeota archaeon]